MIKYKINIMESLKAKGYTSYKLRKEKIFGEATMTKFRNKEYINFENLNLLCRLLDCQPGDILEYVPDPSENSPQTD
jgi:putative transcriptional regulator